VEETGSYGTKLRNVFVPSNNRVRGFWFKTGI